MSGIEKVFLASKKDDVTSKFDPYINVDRIQGRNIWRENVQGEQVVVAVLDTGCDARHSQLQNNIIEGYNFTGDYNRNFYKFDDGNGHGTHVSGIIAASGDTLYGIAPKAKLLILKVLRNDGSGEISSLVHAIHFAARWIGPGGEKVRIINLSLGIRKDKKELQEAIKYALAQNILVVSAVGNDGDGDLTTQELQYPGAYNEVIAVSSLNSFREISHFSNTTSMTDFLAPGEDIVSTALNESYVTMSGTSMATPFVSGALALIINKYERLYGRELTEAELYAYLAKNTVMLPFGFKYQGHGTIQLS